MLCAAQRGCLRSSPCHGIGRACDVSMQHPELTCVVSVSGFRGIVGKTIDAPTVAAVAACYGVTIARRGTVILGQDSRPTGHHLRQAAAALCGPLAAKLLMSVSLRRLLYPWPCFIMGLRAESS